MRSPAFVPKRACAVSSVIQRHACLRSSGAGKKSVWLLRAYAFGLVRSQDPARSRSVLRRHTGVLGVRAAPRAVPGSWQSEARTARLSCRQPVLHQALRYFVRPRCRQASIQDVANELHLDWHTVKELDKQYMREQIERAGTPGPMVIGIDELSIRKRHTYRIMVSDLIS